MLFAEWYQICELPGENDAACTRYVLHLHQSGLLKGDDNTESFFRILTVRGMKTFSALSHENRQDARLLS